MNHHRMRPSVLGVPATLVLLLAAIAGAADAQCLNPNMPTSASTRALAMGDANTAGRDDDVLFYGPAQLAVARGTSAAVGRYDAHLTSATVASTARLATGGVGVGASFQSARNAAGCPLLLFGPGDTPPGTAPRTFSRALFAVGAAQTFKRFRVGATAKHVTRTLGDERADHFLADVGVARDVSVRDGVPLTIALAVQNIGARPGLATSLQAPLRGALGVATGAPVGPLDLGLVAQLALERDLNQPIYRHPRVFGAAGAEVGYSWLDGYSVALRAGVRRPPAFTDLRQLTAGAGLVLDRIAIDYAVEQLVHSRYAHRIGVRLR